MAARESEVVMKHWQVYYATLCTVCTSKSTCTNIYDRENRSLLAGASKLLEQLIELGVEFADLIDLDLEFAELSVNVASQVTETGAHLSLQRVHIQGNLRNQTDTHNVVGDINCSGETATGRE